MRYLFLLNTTSELPPPGTPEADQMQARWDKVVEDMRQAGVLVDCAPVTPPSAATVVRVRDGETILTDGPAAEIKEWLGGYTIVECEDLDDALKWAATLPPAEAASIEVRPIIDTGRRG
jgi:hypothetical protein